MGVLRRARPELLYRIKLGVLVALLLCLKASRAFILLPKVVMSGAGGDMSACTAVA